MNLNCEVSSAGTVLRKCWDSGTLATQTFFEINAFQVGEHLPGSLSFRLDCESGSQVLGYISGVILEKMDCQMKLIVKWLTFQFQKKCERQMRDTFKTMDKWRKMRSTSILHPFFKVFASFCGLEVGFENGCKRMLPKPWKNVGKWGAHTFYIHFLEVFASFGGLKVGFEKGCRMDVKWMWAPGFWRTCWKMDVFRCGLQTCWKTMCFQVSVHTLCKPLVNWLDILCCTEIEEHEVTWLPDAVKSLEKLALGKNKSNHSLYVVAGAIGVKLLCSTSRKFTGHISVCFFFLMSHVPSPLHLATLIR